MAVETGALAVLLFQIGRSDMRKFSCLLTGLVLGVSLLAVPAALLAQEERPFRIAVVDLDAVVAESAAGQALARELEALQERARAEVDRLRRPAEAIRGQIQEGAGSLPPERVAELQREYERIMNDVRRYTDEQQREGQRMQQAGLLEIEASLEPVFEQVQADFQYDVILNRVPGVVVMVGARADITAEVIRRVGSAGDSG
jgi:Skp family chaperone for outer membrane proteins